MSEPLKLCPTCGSIAAIRQELWSAYYYQCRAQEKGIKRLHRKIARLKTMLASQQELLDNWMGVRK